MNKATLLALIMLCSFEPAYSLEPKLRKRTELPSKTSRPTILKEFDRFRPFLRSVAVATVAVWCLSRVHRVRLDRQGRPGHQALRGS